MVWNWEENLSIGNRELGTDNHQIECKLVLQCVVRGHGMPESITEDAKVFQTSIHCLMSGTDNSLFILLFFGIIVKRYAYLGRLSSISTVCFNHFPSSNLNKEMMRRWTFARLRVDGGMRAVTFERAWFWLRFALFFTIPCLDKNLLCSYVPTISTQKSSPVFGEVFHVKHNRVPSQ